MPWSPWPVLGGLLGATALAVFGHSTPVEAADGLGLPDPARVVSITSVVTGTLGAIDQAGGLDQDLAGATRSGPLAVTGPDSTASALLVPLRPTGEILHSALADVGDALPTSLAGPVGAVAGALPRTAAAIAAPGIGSRSSAGLFAGESSVELRGLPARRSAGAEAAGALMQAFSSSAPAWWPPIFGGHVPGLPPVLPLPVNGPGSGGVAPAGGLGSSALAWVAILTIIVALVASARARLGTPATLRSASFVTRTERPG